MAATDTNLRIAAPTLGWLYFGGATIGLVALLLPHPSSADTVGLYSNVGLAYGVALALLLFPSRFPAWSIHVVTVAGAVLITRAILLSREDVSFYPVWYIWIGLYAFYFFRRAAAAGHVALVALLYARTLVHTTASSPVARWLTTVGTLVAAGVLIDTLVLSARRQARAAAASAKSMACVTEVAHELAAISDSASARPYLCQAAARVTAADGVALWEPSVDGASLHLTASAGREPAQDAIPFAGPPGGATQSFTAGNTICNRSAKAQRRLATELAGAQDASDACVWQPILREDLPIAVLAFFWQDPDALDEPSAIALTNLLAVEVAVTLERLELLAELEKIARTDELTGLPNRRAWQEELPRELARAARSQEPLCIAMLDLDHFKRYNDDHGHQSGDRLLKQVAGAWSSELRPTDMLARYGGEEFTLALPACPIDEALTVVERLRSVTPSSQKCSAGIACWDGSETAADLLGRADDALYGAKRRGRDQSTLAAPSRPSASPSALI